MEWRGKKTIEIILIKGGKSDPIKITLPFKFEISRLKPMLKVIKKSLSAMNLFRQFRFKRL